MNCDIFQGLSFYLVRRQLPASDQELVLLDGQSPAITFSELCNTYRPWKKVKDLLIEKTITYDELEEKMVSSEWACADTTLGISQLPEWLLLPEHRIHMEGPEESSFDSLACSMNVADLSCEKQFDIYEKLFNEIGIPLRRSVPAPLDDCLTEKPVMTMWTSGTDEFQQQSLEEVIVQHQRCLLGKNDSV